jgi:hypothetical protein
MSEEMEERLSDAELKAFFNTLFPQGFAGTDVLNEIAPEGWEKSPLVACFHPSVAQVFQESLQLHRRMEELSQLRRKPDSKDAERPPKPEPTLEEIRAEWKESPVNATEEATELVGQCLWDVFSDNHEVVAADGRVVDIGSFRGAGAFLDEYLSGPAESLWSFNYMRFYMGSIWTSRRADLLPIYQMIFQRLKLLGADWIYHFPELGVVDLSPLRAELEKPEEYSPSEAFAKEQEEKERQAELEELRAELAEAHQTARREALDRPPPSTVRAYHAVYGRDPEGWPPA